MIWWSPLDVAQYDVGGGDNTGPSQEAVAMLSAPGVRLIPMPANRRLNPLLNPPIMRPLKTSLQVRRVAAVDTGRDGNGRC